MSIVQGWGIRQQLNACFANTIHQPDVQKSNFILISTSCYNLPDSSNGTSPTERAPMKYRARGNVQTNPNSLPAFWLFGKRKLGDRTFTRLNFSPWDVPIGAPQRALRDSLDIFQKASSSCQRRMAMRNGTVRYGTEQRCNRRQCVFVSWRLS